MVRLAFALATMCQIACGQAREEAPTKICGPELDALREEMEWVDGRGASPHLMFDLAKAPAWTSSTVPERVLALDFGELEFEEKSVARIPDLAVEVEAMLEEFPESDPKETAEWLERDGDAELSRALKAPLAALGQTPVVLAINAREPWQVVRPTLRALSKKVDTLRLLADMPPPPWWDMRLFEEVVEGTDGLGMVADRLSRRAVDVFAGCPDAATLVAQQPGKMVSYVEAMKACDCAVDLAASRRLLHAFATPMLPEFGVVEITVVTTGRGTPIEADPKTPWSEMLPRLLGAETPILLPDPPKAVDVPPPPPPPPSAPPKSARRRPKRTSATRSPQRP